MSIPDDWEPNKDEYAFLAQQLGEARKVITRLRRQLRWCEKENRTLKASLCKDVPPP